MWFFRFQNCLKVTSEISTILVLSVIGVSAFSRSVHSVDSGCTNRVRFSYKANKRRSLPGVLPSVLAWLYVVSEDFSYLEMVVESRTRTGYM